MSNTNTEVLTTAYEKLQKALTQSNTVLPKLEEAIEKGNLDNYATTSDLEDIANEYAKKTEVNSLASSKAEKSDLNVTNANVSKNTTDIATQTARIDSFTSLAEGSTTGDAELIDARTVNGTTYDNAGGAIRAVGNGTGISNNAITFSKRTVLGEHTRIVCYTNEPIQLDIANKKIIFPANDYNCLFVGKTLYKIASGYELDVSGNNSSCFVWYDISTYTFKTFEANNLNENCVYIGAVWWNNTNGDYVNSDFNFDYVIKDDNETNAKIKGNISQWNIYPECRPVEIYSQNSWNIDTVNKKLIIDKTGYCKVFVNGYLRNISESEIDLDIGATHILILYNRITEKLFATSIPDSQTTNTKHCHSLGVVDLSNPFKSTLRCKFTVNEYNSNDTFKRWYNKKIGCLGDSITYGAGGTSWVTRLKELTGCSEAINYGISGTTIETNGTGKSFVERYTSMADDLDLICVWGGVNDHHWTGTPGRPFGNINSPTSETNSFYGALKNLCEGLLTKYPNKTIMFITPMKNRGYVSGDKTCYAWNEPNEIGKTLKDYRNAIIEVCDYYSIPVLDLYSCGGISPMVTAQDSALLADHLHPNTTGNLEVLAPKIASFMNNL